MVTTIRDLFDRVDDPTGLGTDLTVELGNTQVVGEAAIQQAGGGFAVSSRVLHNSILDIASMRVLGSVEIFGITGDPFGEVIARFKENVNTSPGDTNTGYACRLERSAAGVDTLSLQKYVAGVATLKASAVVILGSPAGIVPIQIAVEDTAQGVLVSGFIDDVENPLISFTDNQSPIHQQIGEVGFQTFEGTAQVAPQVLFHTFEAAVLDVEYEDGVEDEPLQWNATKLVDHIRFNVDRNGSLSEMDFDDVLDFLNLAEDEFVGDVGPVEWLERTLNIVVPAGQQFARLPRQMSDEIISIFDVTHNVPLAHRNKQNMDQRFRNRASSNGQVQAWSKVGRVAGDRVQIELFPIPSGDTTLEIYGRIIPGIMAADDYPMVPQEFRGALIAGAIVMAGAASGNERLLRISSSKYKRWVMRARRKDRNSRDIHIVSARALPRRLRPFVNSRDFRRYPNV